MSNSTRIPKSSNLICTLLSFIFLFGLVEVIIIQYYLDKRLKEVLLYYQMGKKVVNPENRQGLTTMVNKLSGVWELLDINNKVIPATETKPFDELVTKYSKVTVK